MLNKEIKVLNTIRGIAALIVIISHYSNGTGLFNKTLGNGAGQIGVMIFFMLSGFLISYKYIDKNYSKKEILEYLKARIARVVPLFYFFLVLSVIFSSTDGKSYLYQINGGEALLTHLLFLDGVSILWTIPVEIQYYFLFIIIWILMKNYEFIAVGITITTIVTLFYLKPNFYINLNDSLINFSIFKSLPFFLTGMILGKLYLTNFTITQSKIWGLSIFLVFIIYPEIYKSLFKLSNPLWYSITTFTTVSFFFITWVFMVPDNSKIYSNIIGDFLGKISYSMYLTHLPILLILKPIIKVTPLMMLPLYIFIVIVVSTCSYLTIENPFRHLINKIKV